MYKLLPILIFLNITLWLGCGNADESADKPQAETTRAESDTATKGVVLFFGNSLTAGYGLDEPADAFPALIQQKIDSLNLPFKVVNGGVSGETSAGGNSRIDWVLKQPVDVFVLELGANDGLRGIPVTETEKNLQSIIDKVKAKYPDATIVIAGMQVPPNMGQQFATDFKEVYPELAAQNNAVLIPFLLEGVGGEVKLNQQDGIHPTAEGHRILASNTWSKLKEVLENKAQERK